MASLGLNFKPSAPDLDWHEYFAEYAEAVRVAKAARAGEVSPTEDDEEPEEEVAAFWVTETAQPIEIGDAPSGVKKVWLAAEALGWIVSVTISGTHHEAVLLKSDGKKGEAGDVLYVENERRHYRMIAHDTARTTGFCGIWMGKFPIGQPIKKNAGFVEAIVRDPYGIPVENYVDYKPSRVQKLALGDDLAQRRSDALDYEYNDGTDRIEHKLLMKGPAFNGWLDGYLGFLAPDHKKLTPAPKAPKQEPTDPDAEALAPIETGEWIAA